MKQTAEFSMTLLTLKALTKWYTCRSDVIIYVTSEGGIDGVSQLQTITGGAASRRTEFVYNIDEVNNISAIRWDARSFSAMRHYT